MKFYQINNNKNRQNKVVIQSKNGRALFSTQ